jgi:hypothetical protein
MIKEKKRGRSAVQRYAVFNVIFLHRDKFARFLARSILPSVLDDAVIGETGRMKPDGTHIPQLVRHPERIRGHNAVRNVAAGLSIQRLGLSAPSN